VQALLDYAAVISAPEKLTLAEQLTEKVIQHFSDENSILFYYTSSGDEVLAVRPMELSDNVIPASNSVMAQNLFRLARIFEREDWELRATEMCRGIFASFVDQPAYHSNWGVLIFSIVHPFYELIVTGKDARKMNLELLSEFQPNVLTCLAEADSRIPIFRERFHKGNTIIHLCTEKTCELPVRDAQLVLNRIQRR
jgi:uncharacterized protein